MDIKDHARFMIRGHSTFLLFIVLSVLCTSTAAAQGLTGALIGSVKDDQGGVIAGANAGLDSPALIGGPTTLTTNEKGEFRFPALPPGVYVLDITLQGFGTLHEEQIRIGPGTTLERTVVLKPAGLAESVVHFVFSQDSAPSTGNRSIASRFDNLTGLTSDAPPSFSKLVIARTTAKVTLSHFQPGFIGKEHQWKVGGELERGGHDSTSIIPTTRLCSVPRRSQSE